MKTRVLSLALLLALGSPVMAQITAVPNSLNFQGRLATPNGNPVPNGTYSVRFSLWTAAAAGTEKWNKTVANMQVKNGTFAVLLDGFAADTFNGNLWLEVKIGSDAALTPRQQLVTVPYAVKSNLALTVPDGSLTAAKIANGTITADKLASGTFNSLSWLLNGNSGVTGGFLGTTDNQPLVLKVNNRRVQRYAYAENIATAGQEFRSINVLGGSEINSIAAGVTGGTIGGGGQDNFTGTDFPNVVAADFGTIGGGRGNTASNTYAAVAGGTGNNATGVYSFIGGGNSNTASNNASTIAGGFANTVSGIDATVGGGTGNRASGYTATIPGGFYDVASGAYSFAAGQQAQANHDGTFVWNDASDLANVFASTGINQFLIHATGGVD